MTGKNSYLSRIIDKLAKSNGLQWALLLISLTIFVGGYLILAGYSVSTKIVTAEMSDRGFTELKNVNKVGLFPCDYGKRSRPKYTFTAEGNFYGQHYKEIVICTDRVGNSFIKGTYISPDGRHAIYAGGTHVTSMPGLQAPNEFEVKSSEGFYGPKNVKPDVNKVYDPQGITN